MRSSPLLVHAGTAHHSCVASIPQLSTYKLGLCTSGEATDLGWRMNNGCIAYCQLLLLPTINRREFVPVEWIVDFVDAKKGVSTLSICDMEIAVRATTGRTGGHEGNFHSFVAINLWFSRRQSSPFASPTREVTKCWVGLTNQ
jgi:hypothetical protein